MGVAKDVVIAKGRADLGHVGMVVVYHAVLIVIRLDDLVAVVVGQVVLLLLKVEVRSSS